MQLLDHCEQHGKNSKRDNWNRLRLSALRGLAECHVQLQTWKEGEGVLLRRIQLAKEIKHIGTRYCLRR